MGNHLCGAGLGFLGFGLSLIIGLIIQNSYITIVARSLVVMIVFYILGNIMFAIGQKVVNQNFDEEVETIHANQDSGVEQDATEQTV